MKKIRLILDDLQVDSFETSRSGGRMGTVEGHMPPPSMYTCPEAGCAETGQCGSGGSGGGNTYQETCYQGCYLTPGGGNISCDPGCVSHYTDCHRC